MPDPSFVSRQPESSSRPRSTSAATNLSQSTRPSISTRTSTRQSTSTQTSDPTTHSPSIPSQDSKFNTTERAILAELQAAVAARAAQFVYKGHPGPASATGGAFGLQRKQSTERVSNRSKRSITSHTTTLPADSPARNSTDATTRSTSDVLASLDVHGGLDNSRRRHHPHVTREVPYPRSYERGVIDL
ncbi:hypothetical protein SERLA73DRAFT_183222 [Serpula lacrymans var. lacrymans S7.3]|uniref:Uncharacterized protein n=1 Tax=Serpula lacrymans var. lacrymans (strain S7.3) TaxID=936435 RepID=F8PZH2_SERL3|nr:hypothetical protein SERLA73DRAFT_183222 [Serpula lacrymans var. lacrymans S7.3]